MRLTSLILLIAGGVISYAAFSNQRPKVRRKASKGVDVALVSISATATKRRPDSYERLNSYHGLTDISGGESGGEIKVVFNAPASADIVTGQLLNLNGVEVEVDKVEKAG